MKNYIVTIARGFGSGGRTIGAMLANELGIGYYDKDISRMASDKSGISEGLFNLSDERVSESIFSRPKQYKGELITPDKADFTSSDNLFNYQASVINSLADSGESCVIVGRCADYVLRDRKNVFRLFIHADLETCIRNTMNVMGITSRSEAEKLIKKTDKERAAYYKAKTGRNWDYVGNYDLILDTSDMDFESCVKIIRGYIGIAGEVKL